MRQWWEILRADFKAKRITNATIAAELGVSEGAVGHWLRGFREPTVDVIAKLCAIAGRSVAEVMSSDPYWISNPTERALIDAWRAMPEDQRQAFAVLAASRQLPKP
jgi:transcriptional regulator with XRE-family HTH domain